MICPVLPLVEGQIWRGGKNRGFYELYVNNIFTLLKCILHIPILVKHMEKKMKTSFQKIKSPRDLSEKEIKTVAGGSTHDCYQQPGTANGYFCPDP